MSDKREPKVIKIRLLLDDPHEEVITHNDLIQSLLGMVQDLSKLEVSNNKSAVQKCIRTCIDHEKLVKEFKIRLREEVKPEVIDHHAERAERRRGQFGTNKEDF